MCRAGMFGLLVACLLVGCRPGGVARQGGAAAPAEAVTLVRAQKQTLLARVDQPGQIEAYEQTPLHARIPGYVDKVLKDIGDPVKEGEVLVRLAVPELDEELKEKTAAVALATAQVEQARQALKAAEAHVQTAQAGQREAEAGRARVLANFNRWQSEHTRVQEMVQRGVIDRTTADETLNQLEAAKAQRSEVEAKVQSMTAASAESVALREQAAAEVRTADARLQVATAAREQVAVMRQFAELKAPFPGVVTRRQVDVGLLLDPGRGTGLEPLFVVTRTDPVRIYIAVPEADAVLIKDDAEVEVRVQALQGRTYRGKVSRSAWALDPQTRTLRTAIDLPNPEGLFRPGMYVNAAVNVTHADAWTLPATALTGLGGETVGYRVVDGKAVKTPVRTGIRVGTAVEVLQYQNAAKAWAEFTGAEPFVLTAAGVSDGQVVEP